MSFAPRILWATFAAPLAVGPAVFVALPLLYLPLLPEITSREDVSNYLAEWWAVTVFMTISGGIFAFFAILFVGYPIFWTLRYFDLAKPLPCALLAGIVGLVGGEFAEPEPAFFGLMGICAAAVAATFCRLANGPENRA